MTDQIKLLNALARKIKTAERTKEQSLDTLVAAKILDKNGRLTAQYANLSKFMSKSK